MSYVKPLTAAIALGLSLTCLSAFAASSSGSVDATPPATSSHRALYYIADWGTPQAHRVYYFKRLDRNHNGQLARAEIPHYMWRLRLHFLKADWNHNGQLSPAEIVMWREHTAPLHAGIYHKFIVAWPTPRR